MVTEKDSNSGQNSTFIQYTFSCFSYHGDSGKSGPKDQVALHCYYIYFAFALMHDSRGIEIVNFTISLAPSAGTLMACHQPVLRTA